MTPDRVSKVETGADGLIMIQRSSLQKLCTDFQDLMIPNSVTKVEIIGNLIWINDSSGRAYRFRLKGDEGIINVSGL